MAGSNMGQVRPGAGPGGSGRHMDPIVAAATAAGMAARNGKKPACPSPCTDRIILHVDVNSAFLSWEAAYRLQHGDLVDLRTIPSVIGGDESARKGIVLACSLPARRFGIHTGETLWQARRKCPSLVVAPPAQPLYLACSQALEALLAQYTDRLEPYSIDECFLDLTETTCLRARHPEGVALEIRDRVRQELGFTVNIGVSVNKLLAKTASEFEKPHRVHTLFPEEMPHKFWTLPVRDLFLAGPRVVPRLYRLNIFSVGHLAQTDPELLERHLGSLGPLLWQFANGYDNTPVTTEPIAPKAIGNSASTPYNVDSLQEALLFLHAVTETAAARLRAANLRTQVITVGYRTAALAYVSHQGRLSLPTDHTASLLAQADRLFKERWDGVPLRHVGVSLSDLRDDPYEQGTLFMDAPTPQARALDSCMDSLRIRHRPDIVMRGGFVASGIPPLAGGPQGASPVQGGTSANGILYGPWPQPEPRQGRDGS
jgi:DNA polymerase IV